jgi:hypothetical protein
MRCAIATVWVCVLLQGCSQNAYLDANLELMNAERRALEDRLYDLEYEYEARMEELDKYRRENEVLKRRIEQPATSPSRPQPTLDSGDPATDDEDVTIPRVEIPDLSNGAAAAPARRSGAPTPLLTASGHDRPITHVEINPRLLSGVDFDDRPGDDGLAIVVEPRSKSGELVRVPGPITVVVLDDAFRGEGERARVARWDLTEADVDRFLQDSSVDEGIRLHLLWPEEPPQHAKLQVYVRYHTRDGRRLDSGRGVRIQLAPRLSQRWTPRAVEH